MDSFLTFLKNSPTAYHAVEESAKRLKASGASELSETSAWSLQQGKAYFVKRAGSLIAFRLPKSKPQSLLLFASHTDSPALKLKPQAEFTKEGMSQIACEIYGAPLLSSWLNRDLAIAGKVLFKDTQGALQEALVNLADIKLTIPQLAIHLDRKVNDEGLILNKQEHLNALFGINPPEEGFLIRSLKNRLPLQELLAHDLFLYPVEEPAFLGADQNLLAGYRLDNLASLYPMVEAFAESTASDRLDLVALFDHEEIGSQTSSGAESPFFAHTLERALLGLQVSREDQLILTANSLAISVDLAHALHPNYSDKHDPRHKPLLGGGVIIKTSAQKRYATEASAAKRLFQAAEKANVPLTTFAARNDLPSGTTIGPIHAALTGMETIDLGIAELSMHSARELIARSDVDQLEKLFKTLLLM
jgi:aspartyl aminopeptidase